MICLIFLSNYLFFLQKQFFKIPFYGFNWNVVHKFHCIIALKAFRLLFFCMRIFLFWRNCPSKFVKFAKKDLKQILNLYCFEYHSLLSVIRRNSNYNQIDGSPFCSWYNSFGSFSKNSLLQTVIFFTQLRLASFSLSRFTFNRVNIFIRNKVWFFSILACFFISGQHFTTIDIVITIFFFQQSQYTKD